MYNDDELAFTNTLAYDEVHVWAAALQASDSELEHFQSLLDPAEHARAQRFVNKAHGANFTIAHGILRDLLGNYLGCEPAQIQFTQNAYGKLALADNPLNLRFNISHTSKYALFAFAIDHEVGVDVEEIRKNTEVLELATRFFSPSEAHELAALKSDAQITAFFNCWSRKEAFIKALGLGLSCSLDKFTVGLPTPYFAYDTDSAAAIPLTILDANITSSAWSLFALNFLDVPNHAMALVTAGKFDANAVRLLKY